MDGITLELPLFLLATFAGALVAGLSGFAFGLVVSSIWLYILTPLQTASLIIAFGLIVQGYSVWKLRRALDWHKLCAVCGRRSPRCARWRRRSDLGQPCLCAYGRRRFPGLSTASMPGFVPPSPPVRSGGAAADAGVGFLNGVLGGITGLAGILVTIWCGLRGWPKDVQRTVFQPVAVAIFLMSALWIGAKGAITADIDQAVSDRIACAVRRHLVRLKAVRPHRRGDVPDDRAGAVAGLRTCPDHLAGSPTGGCGQVSTSIVTWLSPRKPPSRRL